MKSFFRNIVLLCILLSSCMSDMQESEDNIRNKPSICCVQTLMGQLDAAGGNGSGTQTRGWEGDIGPTDQFPSIKYPLDTIFLFAENRDAPMGYDILPFPIQHSGDRKYLDICFRVEEYPDGTADRYSNVYAKCGDKEILVGPRLDCYFSSIPTTVTKMDKSPTIKTPNGYDTYEPYGDKLFRSEFYDFEYSPRDNKIYNNFRESVEEFKTLKMLRATSVVIPRVIISDNYPQYIEGQDVVEGSTEFDIKKFEGPLGSINKWSMRMFLAGNDGKEYYPIEFDLSDMRLSSNEIGYPTRWSDPGIVALSKQELTVERKDHTITDNNGHNYTYKGVGVHDSSFPFIYWTEDLDRMSLCCTLKFNGSKEEKDARGIDSPKTIRFPLTETILPPNQIAMSTFVIDVDDVVAAMTNGKFPDPPPVYSRIIRKESNKAFGGMVEIPTLIFKN